MTLFLVFKTARSVRISERNRFSDNNESLTLDLLQMTIAREGVFDVYLDYFYAAVCVS